MVTLGPPEGEGGTVTVECIFLCVISFVPFFSFSVLLGGFGEKSPTMTSYAGPGQKKAICNSNTADPSAAAELLPWPACSFKFAFHAQRPHLGFNQIGARLGDKITVCNSGGDKYNTGPALTAANPPTATTYNNTCITNH